jgi:NAD(P)-dependent dehydrogenase (short-subunit alcohol dehydrogenase family)
MTVPSTILKDRTALVTGATGGLGQAIVEELALQGCRVFLTGRDPARLEQAQRALRARGLETHAEAADLAETGNVERLARRAAEVMGQVDILVNSAGIFPVAALEEGTVADYDLCFAVNVRAPFLLMRTLAPAMAQRQWGRIANIGSSSAYAGFKDTAVYCSSKHALLGLSRSLYQEYKARGVRVFCLSPGSIQTEMGRKVRGQVFETFIRPEEAARYLSFMISFDGEMISEEVRLNRLIIQ